jgi:hypothetical protein
MIPHPRICGEALVLELGIAIFLFFISFLHVLFLIYGRQRLTSVISNSRGAT